MSVDRILICNLDNLGDMVFASALAPRCANFRAALDIWCKEYTADVKGSCPASGT
jgi:hypothetical protein